ncbi:MAG: chalcone isomerase family protein [Candidatus Thiodiazotropha sp. LLP2]
MTKHTYFKTLILTIAFVTQFVIFQASANQGVKIKDVHFEHHYFAESGDYKLKGAGILTWGILIDLYAAALYISQDDDLQDRRLVIHYLVPIKASKIREVAEEFILKQQGKDRLEKMRASLNRLHAAMHDVQPGDRYALTSTDQGVIKLELNEQEVISFSDKMLAKSYLDIWLGENPIDQGLRLNLIGQ